MSKATPFLSNMVIGSLSHRDSHLHSIYKNRKKGFFNGQPNQQTFKRKCCGRRVFDRPFTSFRKSLVLLYFLCACCFCCALNRTRVLCFLILPSSEGRKEATNALLLVRRGTSIVLVVRYHISFS